MATKSPLIRTLAKRGFAAQAQSAPSSQDVQLKTLSNRVVAAAVPSPAKGIAKVAVAVRAGSRYESADNAGASHIIRSSCGLSTGSVTGFAIMRNLQKLGSTLSATSDRETIVYTLESTVDQIQPSLKFLSTIINEQVFKPWELADNIPRIKYELGGLPPQALLFDLIHQAAYRTGLGNSIFVKDYNIKKLGSETLQHFVANRFLSSKIAVVGLGLDITDVAHFGQCLGKDGNGSAANASPYKGGDVRKGTSSNITHTIVASESSGLNKKDVFTWAVLRNALGSGSSVKWGAGVDPLSKAAAKSGGPTQISAVNIAHSDSGLFGILVSSESDNAKTAVANAMKAAEVTDADVKRGKAQLKAQVLYAGESADGLLSDLANQAVLLGAARSPASLVADIEAVSTSSVQQALRSFVDSKNKSLASIGSVNKVPYLDEL
ncbi:hypothetical protein GE061_002890 [Apolygus lucorum]|uniref:Peptidase M16 N-terminal domain-containing protein n=1 Tax=Apolygus lucorum TaxID=248454 RepID=A0A6A4J5S1_APOLU|nr:hypothetical protein GE061_002890 [Apolygus lucorum]